MSPDVRQREVTGRRTPGSLVREQIRPGITCRELAERRPGFREVHAPALRGHDPQPSDWRKSPSVAYPEDAQPNGERVLEETWFSSSSSIAARSRLRGVKLGDQWS